MSKQLVHVGIQTNYGWYSESWIESRIEANPEFKWIRFRKCDPIPDQGLEPQSWAEIFCVSESRIAAQSGFENERYQVRFWSCFQGGLGEEI